MKPNDKAYAAARKVAYNRINKCFVFDLIKEAVDAAYAAQFQSEDYAGLLKMLRSMHKQISSAIEKADPWGIIDETVPSKAADAIEALLADRDALRKWKEDDSAAMRIFARYRELEAELAAANKRAANRLAVEAERDALLARLAPVDDKALVEIAAKRMCINDDDDEELIWSNATHTQKEYYLTQARAAIAAIRPHIEAAAYEDAARFIEENVLNYGSGDQNYWSHRKGDNAHGLEYAREFREKAAAIRSRK